MSISTKLAKRFSELDDKSKTKLIKMAWEDRISAKDIEKEFGFNLNETEKFMRKELDEKAYKRWKLRQSKRFTLKSKKAANLKLKSKYQDS